MRPRRNLHASKLHDRTIHTVESLSSSNAFYYYIIILSTLCEYVPLHSNNGRFEYDVIATRRDIAAGTSARRRRFAGIMEILPWWISRQWFEWGFAGISPIYTANDGDARMSLNDAMCLIGWKMMRESAGGIVFLSYFLLCDLFDDGNVMILTLGRDSFGVFEDSSGVFVEN